MPRFFLFACAGLLSLLNAEGTRAQDSALKSGTAGIVGALTVTYVEKDVRRYRKKNGQYCRRMTPPNKKRLQDALGGGRILGDGCMGCSVSPVYICDGKSKELITARTRGFEIARDDSAPVSVSDKRVHRALTRFCAHFGGQLVLKPGADAWEQPRGSPVFLDGFCK